MREAVRLEAEFRLALPLHLFAGILRLRASADCHPRVKRLSFSFNEIVCGMSRQWKSGKQKNRRLDSNESRDARAALPQELLTPKVTVG